MATAAGGAPAAAPMGGAVERAVATVTAATITTAVAAVSANLRRWRLQGRRAVVTAGALSLRRCRCVTGAVVPVVSLPPRAGGSTDRSQPSGCLAMAARPRSVVLPAPRGQAVRRPGRLGEAVAPPG